MTLTRNQLLLSIAAVLGAIRFLIVPWIEWQSEQRDALTVLTQRVDRAVGVIENRAAIDKAVVDVEKNVMSLRARFPSEPDVETFRLQSQQQITAIASELGLNARVFEWVLDGDDPDARLSHSRARVQFEGSGRALAQGQAALEARMTHLAVRETILNFRNPSTGPDEQGSLTMVMDLYRRPIAGAAK